MTEGTWTTLFEDLLRDLVELPSLQELRRRERLGNS